MMEKEKDISNHLRIWITKNLLKGPNSLIQEDVRFNIADFRLTANIIAIQSKSNIIHGFDIKPRIGFDNISSAFWQCSSLYTNYKWLVVPKIDWESIFNKIVDEQLNTLGIGIILFDPNNQDFEIQRDAKYIDGNFLKFLPDLENQWITIVKSAKK